MLSANGSRILRRSIACRPSAMIKEHAETGDILVYGPDYRGLYLRAAEIVDKVLKGASAG